jgi:hypothetical protein
MENLTYCGCNPDLPSPQSLTERLAICVTCVKAATCFYPQSITLKMVKSATEESTLDIQEIARNCKSFVEFHQAMTEKCDKLHREPDTDKFYKEPQGELPYEPQRPNRMQSTEQQRSLRDIARDSMTFSDYHERATENDKLPPIKEKKQGLWEIARGSMTFNDYHAKAEQER